MTALRTRLPELVLLANAGAFAVLFAELLLMEHTDGIQLVAPAATASGAALCLVAVVLPGRSKWLVAALLSGLSTTGLVGFVQHMDERGGLSLSALNEDADDDDDHSGPGRGGGDDDEDELPPPLAPLSVTGTALLGALAAAAAASGSPGATASSVVPGRREP